jgi:hypothetical protein
MTQPDDWARTATLYDETAAHQIRIQTDGTNLTWSCTCQPPVGGDGDVAVRRPIGVIDYPIEDVLAAHAAHSAGAVTVDAQRLGLTNSQATALAAVYLTPPRPPARSTP